MGDRPKATCWIGLVLGLLGIQVCTQFVAGDPASPGAR
jgi:hypothetical protein